MKGSLECKEFFSQLKKDTEFMFRKKLVDSYEVLDNRTEALDSIPAAIESERNQ